MGRKVILIVFALLMASAGFSANKNNDGRDDLPIIQKGAHEVPALHRDLSPPLRQIPPAPGKAGVLRVVPNRPLPKGQNQNKPVTGGTIDPVLQMSPGAMLSTPTTNSSFNGVGDGFTGPQGTHDVNVAPPDPVHDVGPSHIVQAVNSAFAVLNKSGSVLYGPVNLNTLWSGFGGGCQSNNDGDPTINYDQIADRWIVMQFSVSTTPYLQCVAVSQTSDPLGSWYRFSYSFSDFNDYPKVGIWPDGYYVTYNMFTATSGYGKVCALDRSKLLTGAANSQQCFNTSTNVMGLLPSDMDGTAQPPAGSPNFVFRFDDPTDRLQMWKFKVNWTTPSSSTFTGPTNITVAAFTESCVSANRGACVPQSGTTSKLEALADRLMNRVAYRNFGTHESLVASHAVGGDTAAQIRWYELRAPNATPTVYQSGTYAPNTSWRWMPSIAMDKSGNIGVGYSISSSSMSPDIYYTGRESTDPLNTLGTEATLLSGVARGSQVGTYGNPPKPLERWGDYAALVIDPSDDCTFWLTSEYLPANGIFNWRTRIGSFKFASCGATGGDTTPPTTSVTAPANGATVSGTSVTISANAADNIGVTNVEFSVDGVVVGSDNTSPYSITWNSTTVANGNHSIASRAYDAAANAGTSSSISVTVSNTGSASFDATLQAPKCSTVGSYCDSGTLLNGRGTMSPAEPNQPNTINDSCADGSSGAYHSDESLDKLYVATNDGTTFAAGKTVNIAATVWCYNTSDNLDLYYAANANSPTWTFIATRTCTGSGAATLTASYTLPSGSLQAIRGNFRFGGAASSCTSGSYNDHDDLIFAAGATSDATPPTTSLTAPANGATVQGTITVSANASDNVGVTKVEFYRGTTLLGTDTTSPYSISWNTTTVVNGNYSLTSKAFDAANNTATSTAVNVTVNNPASCGTASQMLLNPGFESGDNGNWVDFSSKTASPTIISSNTARPARTGSWKAWLNGYGTASTEYIYQQITIPSNACSANLSFWIRIDTAETTTTTQYDKLRIEIRNSANTLLATLATYSNLNKNTTYTQKSFNLSGYKGQTIRVRFYGTEDSSKQTSFVVDDTAVSITQ